MEFNNLPNKELFFTNDVLTFVANELGIPKIHVKEVMNAFQTHLENFLVKDDSVTVKLSKLGMLTISNATILQERRRLLKCKNDLYNTITNKDLLDIYQSKADNIHKIYMQSKERYRYKNYLLKRKNLYRRLYKPPTYKYIGYKNNNNFRGIVDSQNEFAYNHYKKMNLNPSSVWQKLEK